VVVALRDYLQSHYQDVHEKLHIFTKGLAKLKLERLSQPGKRFIQHFENSISEQYPWLIGSEDQRKLY